jgi:hypothetical protein
MSPPVAAWIVHVGVVLAATATTVALTPERDERRPKYAGTIGHYVTSPLALWDGGWYLHVANVGYDPRQPLAPAFWPLYPLVLNIGHTVTGLPAAAVGVLVSNLALLAGLIAMFLLVRATYGRDVAVKAVWLCALSPLAFFFSAVYTEAVFLALTVGALALGQSGRWTGAAAVAGLAALTRSTGILIFLPIGMLLIQQHGWHPHRWWVRAIQLAAAAATPLVFALHLDRVRGDPFIMVRVQAEWGRGRTPPWDTLSRAYQRAGEIYADGRDTCNLLQFDTQFFNQCRAGLQLTVNAISDDLSIVAVTGFIALLPYALRVLLPRDSLYLVVGFLVPLTASATEDPLQSIARYLIVLFPLYVALASLLTWRPLFITIVIGSTMVMCGLTAVFAQGYFVA